MGADLVTTHSNGMSALQLQAKPGIASYKAAWRLLHKLRRAMIDPDQKRLSGVVEIDKTNVPYRKKTDPVGGGQGRSPIGKMVLVGTVEIVDKHYAGRMRLQRAQVADRETLQRFVAQNTARGTLIVTDGYTAYERPPERKHKPHNLSAKNALPTHRDQVLGMVDPERLKRTEKYAFENSLDIFDALDDIAGGHLRHIPIGSKITGTRHGLST